MCIISSEKSGKEIRNTKLLVVFKMVLAIITLVNNYVVSVQIMWDDKLKKWVDSTGDAEVSKYKNKNNV